MRSRRSAENPTCSGAADGSSCAKAVVAARATTAHTVRLARRLMERLLSGKGNRGTNPSPAPHRLSIQLARASCPCRPHRPDHREANRPLPACRREAAQGADRLVRPDRPEHTEGAAHRVPGVRAGDVREARPAVGFRAASPRAPTAEGRKTRPDGRRARAPLVRAATLRFGPSSAPPGSTHRPVSNRHGAARHVNRVPEPSHPTEEDGGPRSKPGASLSRCGMGLLFDAQRGGLTVGRGLGVWGKLTAGTPPRWVALLLWVVVAGWAVLETVRR